MSSGYIMPGYRDSNVRLNLGLILCCVILSICPISSLPCMEPAQLSQDIDLINGSEPGLTPVGLDSLTHITYSFPAYSQRNGLKWMSFPILNTFSSLGKKKPRAAWNFFEPIMFMNVLESINWKVLDSPVQFINNMGATWVGDLAHQIIPQQGYKIQMAQGLANPVSITVSGQRPAVEQYPLIIKAQAANSSDKIGNENWLGYFNPVTTTAREAFEAVIDNLWFVQTQNWTMCRAERLPGSPWIYALHNGEEPTLSFGDMVVVKCFRDTSFSWNSSAPDRLAAEKKLTSHFVYAEKADYVPIFIDLEQTDQPREIALFIDGQCIGAVYVTSGLVELPAYIKNYLKADAKLEIRTYFEENNGQDHPARYQVWDQNQKRYLDQPLSMSRTSDYYKLRLLPSKEE